MMKTEVAPKPAKAYKGMAMEGMIATWYAKNTRKDANRHQGMAQQVRKKLANGAHVLEIAPGPGYFCIELAKLGNYKITGLDISKSFVEIARQNAAEAKVNVAFQQGNASAMPFPAATFDFTFCQAAFKNFTQPVEAIAEMYRVLRPHGIATIVDLRRDASIQVIDRYVNTMGLNLINRLMTKWTFRQMLLKNAYTAAEMEAFVAQTPFEHCTIVDSDDGIGFQVWMEK